MNKSKNSTLIPERDNCQTPGYAIDPLQLHIPNLRNLIFWECASGEGILANAIEQYAAYSVVRTDIEFNFLIERNEFPFPFDFILTNPPFSKKKAFTRQALRYHKDNGCAVALLMQSDVVSTKWFAEICEEKLPGIIWFNPRINFKMPRKGWDGSGSHFPCAWFTWGLFEGNRFERMDHWTKEYRRGFEI